MAKTTGDAGLSIGALQGSPRRQRKEGFIRVLLMAAAILSMVVSGAIVIALAGKAVTFLSNVELGQLWTDGWRPRSGEYDVLTIFIGTIEVSVIAMMIATPLGLGAAMYLSEYANPRTRRRLKPILETLAGIPSVVLGYFALQVINPALVQPLFSSAGTFNVMAAGIGVGILTIPLVASVAEDAMYAVPSALREAAYGIGARRRTVTTKVVFPAAVSGIVAALILGFSRAVGETMVVAIAAGAVGGSLFSLNPCQPGQTMTAAMTALATGSDQVRGASLAFPSLFFVGLLLFGMTLVLNVVSERFVRRVRKRY
jgi:phosphate transport system permease protein